jgi:hypothetical protein
MNGHLKRRRVGEAVSEKAARAKAPEPKSMRDDILYQPLMQVHELPAASIHKYLLHYGLLPQNSELPWEDAVLPLPPPASSFTHPKYLKRKGLDEVAEGETDILKGPAMDGQEPKQADARLTDLVQEHWEKQNPKETETIIQFMLSIRLKGSLLEEGGCCV